MSPHRSKIVIPLLWLGLLSLSCAASAGEIYRLTRARCDTAARG